MRRSLAAVPALAIAALATAVPAHAADTNTTFAVSGGSLSITVPASTDLGTGSAAGTLAAPLGSVTADDARSALGAAWTATVSSTNFTTGAGSGDETIGKGNVDYWSGPSTATSGSAVFVPGQASAVNKQDLSVARTAFSASTSVGNNSATWNPTLEVRVPVQAVAGTYAGTVTHSIA